MAPPTITCMRGKQTDEKLVCGADNERMHELYILRIFIAAQCGDELNFLAKASLEVQDLCFFVSARY